MNEKFMRNSIVTGFFCIAAICSILGMTGCPSPTDGSMSSAPASPTYTITYYANGGSGDIPNDDNAYQQGDRVDVSANAFDYSGTLFLTNYAFAGWNTMADGNGTSYAGGYFFRMGTANVTLYAVWIPSPVTFTSSGTSITITGPNTLSGSLTIPGGVTSIGAMAFSNCTGLTSVTIPSSVRSISSSAFQGCTGLTSLTILSGVTSIGAQAFLGCTGLTNITLPSSLTSTGVMTFQGCTSLAMVTISSGITRVSDQSFNGCTGLTSVTIPSSVTSIGQVAFSSCTGLMSVTIPSSVTSIGNSVFWGCSILSNVIVQAIAPPALSPGSGAFDGCSAGLQIHVPSVTLANYIAATGWSSYATKIISP